MKLSDFLVGVGRPVAYYPSLTKITGGATATILVCQLLYWTDKQQDPDGWIYKTQKELTEETGLSRYEQEGARTKLRDAGLLEEQRKGVPARLYYRVNLEALNAAWETATTHTNKDAEIPHTGMRETSSQDGSPPADLHAETPPTISESTHRPPERENGGAQDAEMQELVNERNRLNDALRFAEARGADDRIEELTLQLADVYQRIRAHAGGRRASG